MTAISQLAKCGRDAKDAVPLLKQCKLHSEQAVRTAATEALTSIEESLAGKTKPPRKEDPPTRPDNTPPRTLDTDLPAQLRPVVARLKSGTPDDRAKAAEELASLGEKAQPAARALCEAALAPSPEVSRAALKALKKVHP